MRFAWIVLGCASLLLGGCSTVETRIGERPDAFHALSPSDQTLVRQGRIRAGLAPDAVYIAWGKPDEIRRGGGGGATFERWVYYGFRTEMLPDYHFNYMTRPVGRRYYDWPLFLPTTVSTPYPYRWARFQNGRLTEWEGPERR